MKNARQLITFVLLPLGLLAWLSFSANAQSSRQVTAVERRIETMNRQASEYEREEMNREGQGKTRPVRNLKPAKVIRAEIEEDLKGLQDVYNRIATLLHSKGEITEVFAKQSAEAVIKYATRLNENLSLPKPDKKDPRFDDALPADTRKSLSTLCKHIYEFITNPLFEASTGFNVEHSAKAQLSLDAVLRHAEKIAN